LRDGPPTLKGGRKRREAGEKKNRIFKLSTKPGGKGPTHKEPKKKCTRKQLAVCTRLFIERYNGTRGNRKKYNFFRKTTGKP